MQVNPGMVKNMEKEKAMLFLTNFETWSENLTGCQRCGQERSISLEISHSLQNKNSYVHIGNKVFWVSKSISHDRVRPSRFAQSVKRWTFKFQYKGQGGFSLTGSAILSVMTETSLCTKSGLVVPLNWLCDE